jgi:hypothetical protein
MQLCAGRNVNVVMATQCFAVQRFNGLVGVFILLIGSSVNDHWFLDGSGVAFTITTAAGFALLLALTIFSGGSLGASGARISLGASGARFSTRTSSARFSARTSSARFSARTSSASFSARTLWASVTLGTTRKRTAYFQASCDAHIFGNAQVFGNDHVLLNNMGIFGTVVAPVARLLVIVAAAAAVATAMLFYFSMRTHLSCKSGKINLHNTLG